MLSFEDLTVINHFPDDDELFASTRNYFFPQEDYPIAERMVAYKIRYRQADDLLIAALQFASADFFCGQDGQRARLFYSLGEAWCRKLQASGYTDRALRLAIKSYETGSDIIESMTLFGRRLPATVVSDATPIQRLMYRTNFEIWTAEDYIIPLFSIRDLEEARAVRDQMATLTFGRAYTASVALVAIFDPDCEEPASIPFDVFRQIVEQSGHNRRARYLWDGHAETYDELRAQEEADEEADETPGVYIETRNSPTVFIGAPGHSVIPRYVGVEIEVAYCEDPRPLYRFCAAYDASIGRDGSLTYADEKHSFELRLSPARGEKAIEMFRELALALDRAGAVFDASCGMHVHVDARKPGKSAMRRVCQLWAHAEDAVFSRFEPRRRTNTYCAAWDRFYSDVVEAPTARDPHGGDGTPRTRYCALNLCSLDTHKTVEFRLFSPPQTGREVEKDMFFEHLLDRAGFAARFVHTAVNRPYDISPGWDLDSLSPRDVISQLGAC